MIHRMNLASLIYPYLCWRTALDEISPISIVEKYKKILKIFGFKTRRSAEFSIFMLNFSAIELREISSWVLILFGEFVDKYFSEISYTV